MNKVSKKNPTFVVVWFLFCFKGKNFGLAAVDALDAMREERAKVGKSTAVAEKRSPTQRQ